MSNEEASQLKIQNININKNSVGGLCELSVTP